MEQKWEQLVLDTLYDRRRPKTETCLVVNEAGIELLAAGREALPILERVIRAVVIPEFTTGSASTEQFLGLKYLLGAYLVISRKTDPDRSIGFIRGLDAPLLCEVLWAIPVFFRRMKEGYNFGCSPGKQLMNFLKEQRSASNPMLQREAESVLAQLTLQDPHCDDA